MENLQTVPLQDRLPLQGDSKSTEKHTLNKEIPDLSFLKNGGIRLDEIRNEITTLSGPAPFDPLAALDSAKVNLDDPLRPPEVAIFAVNGDGDKIPIFTLGNFSMIMGKAKSKKTFFMSMLAASAISEWPIGQLQGSLPRGKEEVIVFDTEQGAYHVQKVAKRIVRLAKLSTCNQLHVYALRKYPYKQRVLMIEAALQKHPNAGLAIIDGTRDLIANINDPEESVMIVGKFMTWSEVFNIHISCVLHQNKGDENARGHLGTESVNKAETVLSVTKDTTNKDASVVESEYTREKNPDRIVFEVNQDGLPVEIDYVPPKSRDRADSPIKEPWAMDGMTHREILVEVFSGLDKPRIKQLYESAASVLGERKMKASKNDIEKLFTWYIKQGRVIQEGRPGTKASYYKLP